MTETIAPPTHQLASLVHSVEQAIAYPLLDRVGDRFSRALKDLFSECGFANAEVVEARCSTAAYSQFANGQVGLAAICRYRLNPTKGAALLVVPAVLVRHLLNGYYGGGGDSGKQRDYFSNGEVRFVSWLGDRCGALQTAAWSDLGPLAPALDGIASDWSEIEFLRSTDSVVAQVFTIKCGLATNPQVTIIYPSDTMNTLAKRERPGAQSEAEAVDAAWQNDLTSAVLQTRLPLRAIFARPKLPVGTLIALKPGDVIPVVLPNSVPVVVAGRRFAEASVGEANGRIAIQILKMEGIANE